jgi:hypothetical protein
MKLFILLCFLLIGLLGIAQERCISLAITGGMIDPQANAIRETASNQRTAAAQKAISEEAVIRIPVVVHVLYHNNTQNISDAQIKSGLQALNRDFRRRNADTVKTPQRFRHLAADVQIDFFWPALVRREVLPPVSSAKHLPVKLGWPMTG